MRSLPTGRPLGAQAASDQAGVHPFAPDRSTDQAQPRRCARSRQEQIARAKLRREAPGETEADQRRGTLGHETCRLRPRPLGAAAATRDAHILPAQAAGLDPEP